MGLTEILMLAVTKGRRRLLGTGVTS